MRRFLKFIFWSTVFILSIRGCLTIVSNIPQKSNKIAILEINGVILNSESILKRLWSFEKTPSIKAVLVRIDSPGGTVGASQEIYSEIKRIRGVTGKKFIASLSNIGTSGAYYIASACDKIIVNKGSITGSIGVISTFITAEKLLEFLKITPFIIKSGKFKDSGSVLRKPTTDDLNYFQHIVMELYNQFKKDVSERNPKISKVIDEIADGRVLTGEEAIKLGLADSEGTFKDAITIAALEAGIKGEPEIIWPKKKAKILEYIEHLSSNIISPLFFLF